MCVWTCVLEHSACRDQKRVLLSLDAEVTGSCESPIMGAGNRTPGLYMSSTEPSPLSHISSLNFVTLFLHSLQTRKLKRIRFLLHTALFL